ncbi:hypothetical protein N7453_008242 [Penicillium expansum]|nr:hypothetical protein N7453_008242 [Penicillium expansum]
MDSSDRMLCHACGRVWTKEDDLTCPYCESEFTEIIEIPPELPSEGSPSHRADSPSPSRANPWIDHNPWERDTQERQAPGLLGSGTPHSPPCAHIDHPTAVSPSAARHLTLELLLVSATMARTLWFR